jgi:WD40 repeat protein
VTIARRLFVLLALTASILAVQSAAASNSPNMRIDYSLNDTTSGRTHSDIAFWGNIAVAGNYDGFRVFNTDTHQLIRSFLCRGPQNDVSLYPAGNGHLLLFQSIDTPQFNGDTVCSQNRTSDRGTSDPTCSPDPVHVCFEGIRIFDLSDPSSPQLMHTVYTDCGSHTHTLVPDLANNRVLLYVSSYPATVGPRCTSPHAKISIVAVPLDDPETASVIATPTIDAPAFIGVGCHDITVFMAIHKAAASCQSQAQLWDITDPANPDTLHPLRIDRGGVNFWHSAEFTWDGQYLVTDDESFSGTCQAGGDGQISIWRVSDGQLMSTYMIPRPQGGTYCSVHNGNLIPVNGRYLLVAAWYGGGTSVIDFTNPANPHEVAYYDATGSPATSDAWSSYWYNGKIYTNDIVRGQDVFNIVLPSTQFGATFTHLNAQTQEDLLPSISATPSLSQLIGHRRALTGRWARQERHRRVTARGRASLSRARG